MTPVTFDAVVAAEWLRQPCPDLHADTRAECLGVDDELFSSGLEGFLATVSEVLAADPDGLRYRPDVTAVTLWRICDGDGPDQGALITVDLIDGIRLATLYQDLNDFAARYQHGVAAAVSALAHIASQACLLVDRYQRTHPDRPPYGAAEGVPG